MLPDRRPWRRGWNFEGIPFDETPLIEAQQRFSHMLEAYPAEAERIQARQAMAMVLAARAEQLYETARFYERTDKPSAAEYYYKELVRQYPSSEWAGLAKMAVHGYEAPAVTVRMNQCRQAGQRRR